MTSTFAGVAPVHTIDGLVISEARGPMVEKLQMLYQDLVKRDIASRSKAVT